MDRNAAEERVLVTRTPLLRHSSLGTAMLALSYWQDDTVHHVLVTPGPEGAVSMKMAEGGFIGTFESVGALARHVGAEPVTAAP